LATKSVSQFTSRRTAFLLHGVINDATTPYLVYLSALFSEVNNPFVFSHCTATSCFPSDSYKAFLHSPIGALVSSLSFLIDSMGTLKVEKNPLSTFEIIYKINTGNF